MILQAVPYYQKRFKTNTWVLQYFQSFNLCVFSITILSSTLVLAKSKRKVVYEQRLRDSLLAYVLVASLLTISTTGIFAAIRPEIYFIFLLLMVFITAVANGLSQNAAFAFAAGFGRTEYAPAIMTGEALAGLLPSTVGM
jgi:solute carrier family 29 (equilibrative nucleoside transporter), member 1/2/3